MHHRIICAASTPRSGTTLEEILYVESRRAARMKRVQTMQHVLAAIALITTGVDHLEHSELLAISEILTGALLIGAVIAARVRHHHQSRIAWVELTGAVMMFVEAFAKTRQRHHFAFYVLSFVQPVVLLMFAVFDAQIATRRYIRVDDRGVELRLRLLFRRRVAWDEIPGYRVLENEIDFGGRRIKLRDIVDQDRAKEWLVDALRRHGVAELPA